MGYVGNQQAEGFVQRPTKQDLTGATGTSLTLSHAVSKEEDIDLYINNVKQEPTTAYTVAGTAVTLTGSVVASDDIYVVYNSLALQTVTPPDGSVTSAKLVYPLTTFSSTGIDDNASSTAMTITSGGSVGIGTTSPSQKLEVSNAGTLALRLMNTATNYWDIENDSNLKFNRGGTEHMRIDSSGNLLVGGTSYSGEGTSIAHPDNSGNFSIFSGSGTGFQWRFGNVSNGVVGSITTSTSATSYNTSSDYRLKENVTDITGATDRLKQLNPVRFNFIADADTTVDGFLAHEVQSVVPEAITGTKDGMRDEEYEVTPAVLDDDGNVVTEAVMGTRSVPDYQGIDQSKLVPLLVATIQELEARIAALESA